jgi:hypothetical protein
VYVEIDEGDDFGQVDILSCSIDEECEVQDIFDDVDSLKRQFTVQALVNCELMSLSTDSLKKMSQEFYDAFVSLFSLAKIRLERLLK